MYYILYLASLCRRRRWPEPTYEASANTTGYTCVVRVNNREYQTDTACESETLARENAAMRAYLICRNFSVNDGMYPAGHDHGGVVQGIPVAIGTGRKHSRDDDTDTSISSISSGGSIWSVSSSPESRERVMKVAAGAGGGRRGAADDPRAAAVSLPVSLRALAYPSQGM